MFWPFCLAFWHKCKRESYETIKNARHFFCICKWIFFRIVALHADAINFVLLITHRHKCKRDVRGGGTVLLPLAYVQSESVYAFRFLTWNENMKCINFGIYLETNWVQLKLTTLQLCIFFDRLLAYCVEAALDIFLASPMHGQPVSDEPAENYFCLFRF